MVLINHLPPLIMSQLPLIYHHFQSHACREMRQEEGKTNIVGLTRWLFEKRICKMLQNAIVTFLKH